MREIIFRGFHKCETGKDKISLNGEWIQGKWVYGNLVISNDVIDGYEMIIIPQENANLFVYDDGEIGATVWFNVIPETVGQYTGLTDKNGTKIFEGDIVKQKTTKEFKQVNSYEWECYGIIRFGEYDWDEGNDGYRSISWYIEPLKSVAINPKDYQIGDIQAGINQSDILDKCYPMEIIGNIYEGNLNDC